jgi:hypothetical protein
MAAHAADPAEHQILERTTRPKACFQGLGLLRK